MTLREREREQKRKDRFRNYREEVRKIKTYADKLNQYINQHEDFEKQILFINKITRALSVAVTNLQGPVRGEVSYQKGNRGFCQVQTCKFYARKEGFCYQYYKDFPALVEQINREVR